MSSRWSPVIDAQTRRHRPPPRDQSIFARDTGGAGGGVGAVADDVAVVRAVADELGEEVVDFGAVPTAIDGGDVEGGGGNGWNNRPWGAVDVERAEAGGQDGQGGERALSGVELCQRGPGQSGQGSEAALRHVELDQGRGQCRQAGEVRAGGDVEVLERGRQGRDGSVEGGGHGKGDERGGESAEQRFGRAGAVEEEGLNGAREGEVGDGAAGEADVHASAEGAFGKFYGGGLMTVGDDFADAVGKRAAAENDGVIASRRPTDEVSEGAGGRAAGDGFQAAFAQIFSDFFDGHGGIG